VLKPAREVQRHAAVGDRELHVAARECGARKVPVRLGLEVAMPPSARRRQAVAEVALGVFQLAALEVADADVQRHLGREVFVVQARQPQ
jgi:hypothetical protein